MNYYVLIVDDDEDVANSLIRTLCSIDYDIVSVKNGEEGLSYLEKNKVDLIISDYRLSGMNGVDFLEAVFKKNSEVVTILVTGQEDVNVVSDAVNRFSLYKFFVKPWDNNQLKTAVKEAFKKHLLALSPKVTAADIMSKFPVTIKENMSLSAAAELMMRFKISGMPVMSAMGKITGIITATDLFRIMGEKEEKSASEGASFAEDLLVAAVMSKSVETVKKEATLDEIIRLMFGKNIHTVPVMEGEELVGIVGRRDVLNAYYHGPRESKNK